MNRKERGAERKPRRRGTPSRNAASPQRVAQLATRRLDQAAASFARGDYEASVARFRDALAIVPGDAEVWANLGCALWKLGQLEEAVSCLERALAIHPEAAQTHSNLASVLQALGRGDEAIAHYQKALALKVF
jgi:tetratricopeptide (TPR) repeat protein